MCDYRTGKICPCYSTFKNLLTSSEYNKSSHVALRHKQEASASVAITHSYSESKIRINIPPDIFTTVRMQSISETA